MGELVFERPLLKALQPSIDAEINIKSVDKEIVKDEKKGFLKKVFDSKSKEEKERGKNQP